MSGANASAVARSQYLMKRLVQLIVAASVGLTMSTANYAQRSSTEQAQPSVQRAMLDRYCVTCHSQRQKDRGVVPIALDNVNLSNIGADAELWEKVVRKLRAGVMPPVDSPRPDLSVTRDFVSKLEAELDAAAAVHPNPGRPLIHRLNRTEY